MVTRRVTNSGSRKVKGRPGGNGFDLRHALQIVRPDVAAALERPPAPPAGTDPAGDVVLHLRGLPGVDVAQAVRSALRRLRRQHGLACTSIDWPTPAAPDTSSATSAPTTTEPRP